MSNYRRTSTSISIDLTKRGIRLRWNSSEVVESDYISWENYVKYNPKGKQKTIIPFVIHVLNVLIM